MKVITLIFDILVGVVFWNLAGPAEGWQIVYKIIAMLIVIIIAELIVGGILRAIFGSDKNGLGSSYRGRRNGGNWYKDFWE